MESRSVYLGIATRLRGDVSGALERTYLHSPLTEGLYYAVSEAERSLTCNLLYCVMQSSLYGNPDVSVKSGNESIPKMFKAAIRTVPYIRAADDRESAGTDGLVEEWKRINAEMASGKEGARADR